MSKEKLLLTVFAQMRKKYYQEVDIPFLGYFIDKLFYWGVLNLASLEVADEYKKQSNKNIDQLPSSDNQVCFYSVEEDAWSTIFCANITQQFKTKPFDNVNAVATAKDIHVVVNFSDNESECIPGNTNFILPTSIQAVHIFSGNRCPNKQTITPDQVCFYNEIDGTGPKVCIGQSQYSFNSTQNDEVSRVQTGSGSIAILYENYNYTGASYCVPPNSDHILGAAMNNRASSFRVEVASTSSYTPENACFYWQAQHGYDYTNQVCFFENSNTTGFKVCTGPSKHNFSSQLNHKNNVSAVIVGKGVHSTLYTNQGQSGSSVCITGDSVAKNIGIMNNSASSFEVAPGSSCGDSYGHLKVCFAGTPQDGANLCFNTHQKVFDLKRDPSYLGTVDIASITVGSDTHLTLYEKVGYGGRSQCIPGNSTSTIDMIKKFSSFKILPDDSCPNQ